MLSQRRNPKIAQPIVAALADTEAAVRVAAAKALVLLNPSQAEEVLIGALKDVSAVVRSSAATALVQLKSKIAVDPLIALLSNAEQEVLDAAATALRQIGDARMADAMLNLLATAHGVALHEAIYALGELQDERALPILTSIRQYKDKRVETDWRALTAAQHALNLYKIQPSGQRTSSSFKSLDANFGGISALEADTTYALSGADLFHHTEVFVTSPREEVSAQAIKDLNGEDSNLQSIAADTLGKLSGEEAVDALLSILGIGGLFELRVSPHRRRAWSYQRCPCRESPNCVRGSQR